jgi:hypothetical protein
MPKPCTPVALHVEGPPMGPPMGPPGPLLRSMLGAEAACIFAWSTEPGWPAHGSPTRQWHAAADSNAGACSVVPRGRRRGGTVVGGRVTPPLRWRIHGADAPTLWQSRAIRSQSGHARAKPKFISHRTPAPAPLRLPSSCAARPTARAAWRNERHDLHDPRTHAWRHLAVVARRRHRCHPRLVDV